MKFDREITIQKMIENNMKTVFPNLEFLTSEFCVGNFKTDTLAYDEENNCFAIIEYKKKKNISVTDQTLGYYGMLAKYPDSFVNQYNKNHQNGMRIKGDFNWEEPYVIIISPEFTKYQIAAEEGMQFFGNKLRLYEIAQYEGNTLVLDEMATRYTGQKELEIQKQPDTAPLLVTVSEEDYLSGEHSGNPTTEIKDLYKIIRDYIMELGDLDKNVTRSYIGFRLNDSKSYLCTLGILTKRIKVYLNVKAGAFPNSAPLKDVSKKGKLGVGNYSMDITKKTDVEVAMEFLKKAYEIKTGHYPNTQ